MLWFLNYSTWEGRHGIYLEDLYVRPEARGSGLGTRMLATLADLCIQRDYRRLQWWVLDWNPARDFYATMGAVATAGMGTLSAQRISVTKACGRLAALPSTGGPTTKGRHSERARDRCHVDRS